MNCCPKKIVITLTILQFTVGYGFSLIDFFPQPCSPAVPLWIMILSSDWGLRGLGLISLVSKGEGSQGKRPLVSFRYVLGLV